MSTTRRVLASLLVAGMTRAVSRSFLALRPKVVRAS